MPYQAAAFQTSSLEGCLSDSRQLCLREITHQLSQGGACKTGEKLWFFFTNHIKDRFENLFAFIAGGGGGEVSFNVKDVSSYIVHMIHHEDRVRVVLLTFFLEYL